MSIGWNQVITGGQGTAQSGILPFKTSTETQPRQTAKPTYEGISSNTPIDKVVILTTSDLEHNAVQAHLEAVGIREEINEQGTIYTCGQFHAPNCQWQVAIAQINIGNARAEAEVGRAIRKYSPSVILLVGIAEGVTDIKIGDVVAATQVYNYESSRASKDETVPILKLALSPHRLEQRASAEARKGDWKQRIISPLTTPDLISKAHVGSMAAGEKEIVSDRSQIYRHIREYYTDAIAVDLSGYGFLAAAFDEKVDGMVIRGIGHLLNRRKNNNAQANRELAARHASAFAFEILAKLNGTSPASEMGEPIQPVFDLRDDSPPGRVINISIKEHDGDEYGISVLHGRSEIVMSGRIETSLLQALEIMKKKMNSLDIIDYLDRCNERLKSDISCPIAQLLKWLANNVDFEDEDLVLAIFDSTKLIIPWELLEIHNDRPRSSVPIGGLLNTVYASHFSEELNYLYCCEGGILSYSNTTNHYLQAYCCCDHSLSFDELILQMRDTTRQYALISIDAYSSEQIGNNPMPSIRRSNLRDRVGIIVINGQLNFAVDNLTHQDFVKLVYTYGAKGVISSLELVEAKIGRQIIDDFFNFFRDSDSNVDRYIPFFLRQIRKRAYEELQHNLCDDTCSSYLATSQYIYYGNPYTTLRLTPANP